MVDSGIVQGQFRGYEAPAVLKYWDRRGEFRQEYEKSGGEATSGRKGPRRWLNAIHRLKVLRDVSL